MIIVVSVALMCIIVVVCVSLHYEALSLLSRSLRIEKRWYSNRFRATLLVLGCLVAHGTGVIMFGSGYQILEYLHEGTDLLGTQPDYFNCNYYSLVVYTSIGFGDVVPLTRAMRILTAAEGLTGAILIAWTASFMFFHMQHFWALESQIKE